MGNVKDKNILKSTKRYLLFIIFIALTAFGAALSMKAGIGVGALDALNLNISALLNIKIGTFAIISNCSFLLLQILLLRKDFHMRNLLQIPLNLCVGYITNIFYYDVLGDAIFDTYIINLFFLLLAYFIIAISISAIMAIDIVTFSLEGLSMAISKKFNISFGTVRLIADIIFFLASVFLSIFFKMEFFIREGTVIGVLLIGPLLGFFTPKLEALFLKWNIL